MIRPAGLDDAAAIATLEAIVTPHPWSERSAQSTLSRPTTAAWVVELDGQVVGHLITTLLFERAEVLLIAVDPERRRQGLGERLLRHGQEHWAVNGATEAWLEVRVNNQAARSLYERLGWTEHSVRPYYYTDGTDAAVYTLAL